jgi:hypothetical protein
LGAEIGFFSVLHNCRLEAIHHVHDTTHEHESIVPGAYPFHRLLAVAGCIPITAWPVTRRSASD